MRDVAAAHHCTDNSTNPFSETNPNMGVIKGRTFDCYPCEDDGSIIDRSPILTYQKLSEGYKWFAKRTTKESRERFLRTHPWWKLLGNEARGRIAMYGFTELQRRNDTWFAIGDSLLMSTPELFKEENLDDLKDIWKWCWSTMCTYNGVDHMTKRWKMFVVSIKHQALKSLTEDPKVTCDVKWFNHQTKRVCPSKLPKALDWLSHVITHGVQNKTLATRLMHLASTRGTPAPRIKDMGAALNEHGAVVCEERDFVTNDLNLKIHKLIAKRLGAYVKSRRSENYSSTSHLSLTNSACFENSRTRGGRAVEVGTEFALWANEVMKVDRTYMSVLGILITEKAGMKRFQTLFKKPEHYTTSDSSMIESDNTFEIDWETFFTDYKFEDRIYGLDSHTGYQMVQWAYEVGVAKGCLDYVNPTAPAIRMVPIGEPGSKTRTITVGEAWLSQFLSPLGHELISLLGYLPQAASGLSAAAMAYEWAKRLHMIKGLDETFDTEDLHFLTSDLTQASEYLEYDFSEAHLTGFLEGVGSSNRYTRIAIRLLCSPRVIDRCEGKFNYDYLGCKTVRGSLMGDPGTKGALTLHMVVAEEIAYLKYQLKVDDEGLYRYLTSSDPYPESNWRCFASAGDDHSAIGPLPYLRGIKRALTKAGSVISEEKSFESKIGLFFTEEMIVKFRNLRFHGADTAFWRVPYALTVHIDAVKIRLLSPCSIVTMVRDEKNPALGKAKQFFKKLAWLPEGFGSFRDLAYSRFRFRFNQYLPWGNPMVYLPPFLGGLGLPLPKGHEGPFTFLESFKLLPELVCLTICKVIKGTATESERRALWLFSANSTYRGETMRSVAEAEVAAMFNMMDDTIHSREDLRVYLDIDEDTWSNTKSTAIIKKAKLEGYIRLSDAIQEFERPTYFKEVMAGLSNLMEENPLYRTYKDSIEEMDSYCKSDDLTYSEVSERFPILMNIHQEKKQAWFAEQARIETGAFERVGTRQLEAGKPTKGFNTKLFPERFSEMEKILRRHATRSPDPDSDLNSLCEWVIKKYPNQQDTRWPHSEEIWIKMNRISPALCTLRVPKVFNTFSQEETGF